MIENEVSDSIEVLEQVIIELAEDFRVSRQAAKIRLVELGIDEASRLCRHKIMVWNRIGRDKF